MAATSTPAATHDCSSKPTIRRWNHYSTPTSITQATPASKAPPDTTQVLWTKPLLRLEEEKLGLDDLPTTEEPLWGMLYELSFTSYLERGKLCKQISAGKLTPPAKHSPTTPRVPPLPTTQSQTQPVFCHIPAKEAWTLLVAQHTKWHYRCARPLKIQHFGYKCHLR